MDHIELSKRLRDLSKDGSSYKRTICKMAAQKIDKLASELEATKALLAQAVADLDCKYCEYNKEPAACTNDEQEYPFCKGCRHDCPCKDCDDNSKWEYLKTKEANQ